VVDVVIKLGIVVVRGIHSVGMNVGQIGQWEIVGNLKILVYLLLFKVVMVDMEEELITQVH
jgi:hypothetical protein